MDSPITACVCLSVCLSVYKRRNRRTGTHTQARALYHPALPCRLQVFLTSKSPSLQVSKSSTLNSPSKPFPCKEALYTCSATVDVAAHARHASHASFALPCAHPSSIIIIIMAHGTSKPSSPSVGPLLHPSFLLQEPTSRTLSWLLVCNRSQPVTCRPFASPWLVPSATSANRRYQPGKSSVSGALSSQESGSADVLRRENRSVAASSSISSSSSRSSSTLHCARPPPNKS
ncbi:uncharacterized protein K460DRAFT_391983 [Cucurbitaria berberidis CBS 394.84]|uniref:Uncharacterized protein n=1 Tax=Cucurbitaria berberidis CBS 394.84 TaxID=1168544 RepID=A0A9P4LED2_9PLEO|nr:uncharacterized protein K460DRAFT_391983 [Cucurbitaria berberidis CBS 394.84]KAF1851768.1 hypothetical protein K460DRAFT_391983 [Cucurbitaria berberidis CBS 394.84]